MKKNPDRFFVFKSVLFYKDLFFSVFNIIHTENNVSVKYKTKNIKTDGKVVFLTTINQMIKNTNSSRNLSPTASRLCRVWLSASLVCPRKKMMSVTSAITDKNRVGITISAMPRFTPETKMNRYPAPDKRILKNKSMYRYL